MNTEHSQPISIERLSHEGRGVAHIDGKTIFVDGALAGEVVTIRYLRRRNSYDEASVVEILQASPERKVPHCSHFGLCGGCSLQHLSCVAQVQHKQQAFLELLTHQAHIQPNIILPALTADPWGYRRKARIGVKYVHKKNKVLVGFRERDRRFIADLSRCEVLEPRIGHLFTDLSKLIGSLSIKDQIAQFEVALSDEVTAIIIRHLAAFGENDLAAIEEFATVHNLQIYLQPKGIDSIHLFYPSKANPLLSYELPDYGLKLEFHPIQFTQVNFAINQIMIKQALTLLELNAHDYVLDLFCGIGNFSLPLALQAELVVGIEGDKSAVKQAELNATLNQINNAKFYVANLFEDISHHAWAKKTYNKILLDPPRAGAQEIIPQLKRWGAERIVYISCNPATLARDTKLLLEQGYQLQAAGVIDMFPHTQHVEAMALFCKS